MRRARTLRGLGSRTALAGATLALATAATLALATAATLALATGAAFGGTAPAPALVRSASLRQQGLVLRFDVTLAQRFSPAGLAASGRTLCLLIEAPHAAVVEQQLCLAPARGRHGQAHLELAAVHGPRVGPERAIDAAISRPSAFSLLVSFTPTQLGRRYRSLRWQVRSALTPTACARAQTPASGRADCPVILYPSRPAFAHLHIPRLVGCAPGGGSTPVFSGPADRREIALTFDDGPWPDPPSIDFVRLLHRYRVPATFFEIGDQISEYDPHGAVERLMLKDGDMIGDHTWTHPDMVALSPAQQRFQLKATANAIRHATGFEPCLWRPPYGDISPQLDLLARSLGFRTIYWDIDPRDWSLPGTVAIETTVIDNAHNGGIVEMHFGGGPRYETLAALPDIIQTLRRRGYRFVNLATMLGLRLIYR
jgi:peptidoglycan/xylan/chitin deacetylase (PgdA/CDA1 family)